MNECCRPRIEQSEERPCAISQSNENTNPRGVSEINKIGVDRLFLASPSLTFVADLIGPSCYQFTEEMLAG
ncbi:hypothetical protein FF011L_03490 [Roseimaritima multifibrata]|uniref:Uncharacterized protein n=1 Tax=Roseimaritima multifibrata TaxID=1930274 RepID=A0A517M9Q7_9BACT|nr:hypothetical protein FF011L_03490 [Roseimaritima multifibrata]